ncbi:MAG TPA: threonine synthase [Bacteroidales bacterium]|nr:threonine synthase [Bacteroidales bacterium]
MIENHFKPLIFSSNAAMEGKFIYECITCGKQYGADQIIYLCHSCRASQTPGQPPAGILRVLYDFKEVKKRVGSYANLKKNRFLDILPYESNQSLPGLKIGQTPLYLQTRWGGNELPYKLYLKDDSQNPTFSFKDRASAVVSAFARERGVKTLVAATTGNAGSSLAGICAAQGQKAIIMVPQSAPVAKLTQVIMYGATLVPVKGTYDDAFDLSVEATNHFGWYNRNTGFNPLTIEGKKTVALELLDQFEGRVPDHIFLPVGDGVVISGVYKGYEDLMRLGYIDHMPAIVGVQSSGSDNLARHLHTDIFKASPSHTIADSISVDIPRNFFMAKNFVKKYNGNIIAVSDEQIIEAAAELASNTGIFTEPASAASFAGYQVYARENRILPGSENLVLLTGSGLKDLKSFATKARIPEPVNPDIESLKAFLK